MKSFSWIHKIDIHISPIVSVSSLNAHKLPSFLEGSCKSHLNFRYTVKNSYNVVEELSPCKLPNRVLLVSFDMTNMSTST